MKVDDALPEAAMVKQLERYPQAGRQRTFSAPTVIGVRKRWHSSTRSAPNAWAASSGPPTEMSRLRRLLELANRLRVKLALDSCPRA